MSKNWKFLLISIIVLLFVFGIGTSMYLYMTGFDFKAFFVSLNIGIYQKIGILLGLYLFRNYLFVPSTVIILITWALLQNFYLSAIVSIVWVSIGIAETYIIGYFIWKEMVDTKKLKIMHKYKKQIQENGVKIVFFSCMFPLTPVDILYYAAGFIRYKFVPFFFAALLGEMWLILLYVFVWVQAEKYVNASIYFILASLVIFWGYYFWKKRRAKIEW